MHIPYICLQHKNKLTWGLSRHRGSLILSKAWRVHNLCSSHQLNGLIDIPFPSLFGTVQIIVLWKELCGFTRENSQLLLRVEKYRYAVLKRIPWGQQWLLKSDTKPALQCRSVSCQSCNMEGQSECCSELRWEKSCHENCSHTLNSCINCKCPSILLQNDHDVASS